MFYQWSAFFRKFLLQGYYWDWDCHYENSQTGHKNTILLIHNLLYCVHFILNVLSNQET